MSEPTLLSSPETPCDRLVRGQRRIDLDGLAGRQSGDRDGKDCTVGTAMDGDFMDWALQGSFNSRALMVPQRCERPSSTQIKGQ